MKRVDHRTDNIFDGGRIQIRDRSLRITFPTIPSAFVSSQDIEPDECCADAPGNHLLDAAADLLAFYDKWYGAGGRSSADGYYTWSNASCPPPGNLRVPTATHLDDISQADELCGDPPEIFDAFNAMRDATVHMAELVRQRPKASTGGVSCPKKVPCDPLNKFTIRFSPTRSCVKPNPCEFDPSFGSIGGSRPRVTTGEKLCLHHYIELEDIIDKMMTDGVVEFYYSSGGLLVKSGTACDPPADVDRECVDTTNTEYVNSTTTSCCNRGACCFGAGSSITSLVAKELDGQYYARTDLDCCDFCFHCDTDCPASPMVDADISKWSGGAELRTYTQNGSSIFNFDGSGECAQCSWEVPCSVSLRSVNMDRCDRPACEFTDTTEALDDEVLTVWWDINSGTWRIGALPNSEFTGSCTEITDSVGYESCKDGVMKTIVAEWGNLTCDPANGGCGSNCACGECPCPGTIDSVTGGTSDQPIGLHKPDVGYDITSRCGAGIKTEHEISAQFQYGADCPDSSLTNIVMLDPRINTINDSTYTETVLSPPSLDHPGCRGRARRECAGFECLRGYGELA